MTDETWVGGRGCCLRGHGGLGLGRGEGGEVRGRREEVGGRGHRKYVGGEEGGR